jgi:hypothetical protein
MENKTTSNKYFWPAVVVVVLVLAIVAGLIFFFLLPKENSVSSAPVNPTLSPADLQTQAMLYNPTPPADAVYKPADKLIIKTVNFDKSGNIVEVFMYAPAAMADGSVIVDGQQVEVTRTQKDKAYTLNFSIPSNDLKKSVTFIIEKSGKQVATCSLAHTDTVVVAGDCIF